MVRQLWESEVSVRFVGQPRVTDPDHSMQSHLNQDQSRELSGTIPGSARTAKEENERERKKNGCAFRELGSYILRETPKQ